MRRAVPLLLIGALTAGCTGADEPVDGSQAVAPVSPSPSASAVPSPTPAAPPPSPSPVPSGPAPAELPPPVPADADGLAAVLTEVERTIRAGEADGTALADAGRRQQAAYRELAARIELRPAVLERMPADLHGVVVAHTGALRDLLRLTKPQPSLPSWRIVEPPPPEELLQHYREAERTFGVGWEYLAAIHLVESRMGRIRGTSPAGAQGPMQFMPGTWDIYGEGDIDDPRDAVLAAGRYLRASGAPGDMRKALFAYNRSDAYVRAVSTHAAQMRATPAVYGGYWHWQVYYRTVEGDRVLPVGYDGTA